MRVFYLAALFAVSGIASTHAQKVASGDWPTWRGPTLDGVAEAGQKVPTKWDATTNVLWRVKIPGRGHSSPTIVGDRIFLATADERRQTQSIIALNRTDGKPLWKKQISKGGFPKTHPKNTHASGTVAYSDGRVFGAFHHDRKLTVAAISDEGKPIWSKDVGPFDPRIYEYGYAPSPLLYKTLLIIAADYERGGFIVAFDQKSGEIKWQLDRPQKLSFSSPVIANVAGKDQLLISGCEKVSSYNPADGSKLWSVNATTMATCGTMVWDGDTVFASGGYPKPETVAVKADGSGKILWRNRQKCYEQSMLAHKGYVYAATDRGVAYCWKASDGTEMWRGRVKGPISASPVLVGDTIYQSVEDGTTYVFKADPSGFKLVAENKLGTEAFASPTICGDRIYLRIAKGRGNRQEWLYCIGFK